MQYVESWLMLLSVRELEWCTVKSSSCGMCGSSNRQSSSSKPCQVILKCRTQLPTGFLLDLTHLTNCLKRPWLWRSGARQRCGMAAALKRRLTKMHWYRSGWASVCSVSPRISGGRSRSFMLYYSWKGRSRHQKIVGNRQDSYPRNFETQRWNIRCRHWLYMKLIKEQRGNECQVERAHRQKLPR